MRISIKILAYLPVINAFNEKFLLKIKDLYQKEALQPYYICNNRITIRNDQIVCYEINQNINFENQIIWTGNIYLGYKNIYEYLIINKPLKLPEVLDLMVENVITMEDIYKNAPVLHYYNNISKELVVVFILHEVFDIIIVKAKENPIVETNTSTYTINSIEKYEKNELFNLFQKLTKYSVGMLMKTSDLQLLEKLSVVIPLDNHREYHLIYYDNHFYGDCNKNINFSQRPLIYFIITLDENNVMTNMVLKTSCCPTT